MRHAVSWVRQFKLQYFMNAENRTILCHKNRSEELKNICSCLDRS